MDTSELLKKLSEALARIEILERKVEALQIENAELRAENKELRERLAKNSSNSSKPPSSDGFNKPKPKNLRGKSDRKSGGQKGRKGECLKMVEKPDKTVIHAAAQCSCGHSMANVPVERLERRQVFDIPPINIKVTEHQAEIKRCPCCGREVKAAFPEGVSAATQYGERIRAFANYMAGYQSLPFARCAEFFRDILGVNMSEGTLANIRREFAGKLKDANERVKAMLLSANVIHCDETGISVNGKTNWLHVVSTPLCAFYEAHAKRGREAMDAIGILPFFRGTAIHDHLKPYYSYACSHGECNAHILRELKFLAEERDQKWAAQMMTLLVETNEFVKQAKEGGRDSLSESFIQTLSDAYDQILAEGSGKNPKPPPSGKRGRAKQTKERNMLDRMLDFKTEIPRFAHDFRVPFDNNLAERDLRMIKAKQKISGAFRGDDGAPDWLKIRAYISTAKKNAVNVLAALANAWRGSPFIPERA